MANIDKLNFTFTDGQTTITANHLNSFVDRINRLIDAVGGDTPSQTVATPTISINGTSATITCSTSNATIYYTLNGDTPTTSSTQYTGAITLSGACTIKAIAVKDGISSGIATQPYTPSVVLAPTIVINGNSCSMSAENGAAIYYTLNGDTPTTSSNQYSSAITLSSSCSVKAIAVKNGTTSTVSTATYTAEPITYPYTGTGETLLIPLVDIGSQEGDVVHFVCDDSNIGIFRGNATANVGECSIVWEDSTHGYVDLSGTSSTHLRIYRLDAGETITFISNGRESSPTQNYIDGKYYTPNTPIVNSAWGYFEYLPYNGESIDWFYGSYDSSLNPNPAIVFFDENKNYISNGYKSGYAGQNSRSFQASDLFPTAKFVNVPFQKSYADAKVIIGSTTYIPHN